MHNRSIFLMQCIHCDL